MSDRQCGDWIKTFLDYASFGEAPMKFLFWTGVSTVAGALRRRVWLDMKNFQWVPNFYIVLVAPPGVVSKSTTINIGMNLLRDVDGVKFGPDSITWQALVTQFAAAQELVYQPATQEYLPMSCLTIASDEFGTFFRPDDNDMVNLLIALWDGKRGSFSKITKMAGSDSIENPWINMIACTTPTWIADNFSQYMIGGGFTSRCIFIYADKKRQLVAYPDESAPGSYHEVQAKLIHDLEVISTLTGEFKLTQAAREWGRHWYATHNAAKPAGLDTDQFGGYLARKQTHIHKLAMVLTASRQNDLLIEQDVLEAAEGFVTALEKDMPLIYSRIGQTEITRGSSQIMDIVSRRGSVARDELYAQLFRTMNFRDFEMALTGAIQAGHLIQQQVGDKLIVRLK